MAPRLIVSALLAAASADSLAKTLVSVERLQGYATSALRAGNDASVDVDVRTLPSLLSPSGNFQLDGVDSQNDLDQCLREAVATFSLVGVQVVSTGSDNCHLSTAQFCEYVIASVEKLPGHSVTCEQNVYFPLANIADAVDDPLADQQYGPDLIDVQSAWADSLDAEEVIVAIIDTGITADHEDLHNVLWDDGKGNHGRNLVDPDNESDLTDELGHGTHCAGIVGAQVNNAIGVAGANPNVKIMALKASEGPYLSNAAIVAGLDFAGQNNAKVVSMSFGGPGETPTLAKAMRRAEGSGALLVSAAGNDGSNSTSYPCAYASDQTLCVAATGTSKKLATFSTYGLHVDIAAPGADILSTYNDGAYIKMSGTSMSTPLVAGVASILAGLGLSAAEIKTTLKGNVDKLRDVDMPIGGGFMNAAKAVKAAKSRKILI